MKKQLSTLFLFLTIVNSHAQLTYVPDDAFENYLETFPYLSNGISGDNYISSNNVSSLTVISIIGNIYPVEDFTGIEVFNNLTSIFLTSLMTATIDLSMVNAQNLGVNVNTCLGVENIFFPSKMTGFQVEFCSLLNNVIFSPNSQIAVAEGNSAISFKNNNSLEVLDLSGISLLNPTYLMVQNNPILKCVNIQNGDNLALAAVAFVDNNILSCVQVDNLAYSANASTWSWHFGITDMNQYSTSCSNCTLGLEKTTQTFTLSPNPVHELLKLTVPSSFVGEDFHVYTAKGEQVQHGVISSEQQSISVDQLPSGVYFFSVDGMLPKRLVKL